MLINLIRVLTGMLYMSLCQLLAVSYQTNPWLLFTWGIVGYVIFSILVVVEHRIESYYNKKKSSQ